MKTKKPNPVQCQCNLKPPYCKHLSISEKCLLGVSITLYDRVTGEMRRFCEDCAHHNSLLNYTATKPNLTQGGKF